MKSFTLSIESSVSVSSFKISALLKGVHILRLSDGDGLANGGECVLGTNPWSKDSDEDGLEDRTEVEDVKTDPLRKDTDSDGLPDGWEVANGLDPLSDGGVAYGLVARWTFDEGGGGVVSNSAGTNWNGVLKGMAPGNWQEGRCGGASR